MKHVGLIVMLLHAIILRAGVSEHVARDCAKTTYFDVHYS
jgi:hypothetical protein